MRNIFLYLLLLLASIIHSFAATTYYVSTVGGTGSWNTPAHWSGNNNPPNPLGNTSDVTINGSDSIVLSGSLTVGNTTNLLVTGKLNITSSLIVNNNLSITINSGGRLYIGGNAAINNNTNIIINSGGKIIIGGNSVVNNNTNLTINGGGLLNVGGNATFGNNATGIINGIMNVGANLTMGSNYSLTGTGALNIGGLTCGYWSGSGSCIDSSTPLPVEFVKFEGKFYKDQVFLNWATASELNNHYFSVEKSTDGVLFTSVGKVGGGGTKNELSKYTYNDISPLEPRGNYYRLKQVDFNGDFKFSKLIFVKETEYSELEVPFMIYPTPAHTDELLYEKGLKEITAIKLTNLSGLNSSFPSYSNEDDFVSISLQDQKPGVYFITIMTTEFEFKKRFIIE